MAKYIVTSNRLDGLKRGDVIDDKDLDNVNIQFLLEAGHLSTQETKKPAKTKDTEQKD